MNDVAEEFKKTKELVERFLAEYPKCRNSDKELVYRVWSEGQGVRLYIPFAEFERLIPIESITRARRIVQNKERKYLPTDSDVIRRRRIKEEALREILSTTNG
jgi:hypothetical protein